MKFKTPIIHNKNQLNLPLLIITSFLIFFIFIIIVFIFSKINEPHHHTGESLPDHSISFNNRYLLTKNLDTNPGNELSDHITSVVLNEEEIKSAPTKNKSTTDLFATYTVNIIETSFKSQESPNYEKEYSFIIEVSDNRKYSVKVLEDPNYGNYYLGSIITRTDKKTNSFVFFDYNEDRDMFGQKIDYVKLLQNWVSLNKPENPIYNTSSLIINNQ
jgi:hypothetical protein